MFNNSVSPQTSSEIAYSNTYEGRVRGFFSRHDPDEVFAYNTIKMVTIKDRYLGLLHHFFQLAIFIYILIYVIFIELQFLYLQPAIGAMRLNLINRPGYDPDYAYYCSKNVSLDFPQKLPCLYNDQVGDTTGYANLLITTHMTITEYKQNCNASASAFSQFECDRIPVETLSSAEYFIGNVEGWTLSIDHSPVSPTLGTKLTDKLYGELQEISYSSKVGPSWNTYNNTYFDSLSSDLIPLTDLLGAAGLNLDDQGNEYLLPFVNDTFLQTNRYFGAVILFLIEYDNTQTAFYWKNVRHATSDIYYYYRPILVPQIEDFDDETMYINYPDHWVSIRRRGIRVIGSIDGNLGSFQFQTLLIQLTTSLALMRVATLLVDNTAILILPRKLLYRKAKYEKTVDFSEFVEEMKVEGKSAEDVKDSQIVEN